MSMKLNLKDNTINDEIIIYEGIPYNYDKETNKLINDDYIYIGK